MQRCIVQCGAVVQWCIGAEAYVQRCRGACAYACACEFTFHMQVQSCCRGTEVQTRSCWCTLDMQRCRGVLDVQRCSS
jgi:hypothetical protein